MKGKPFRSYHLIMLVAAVIFGFSGMALGNPYLIGAGIVVAVLGFLL
jgi:cytochrome b subunit of formate dehydrogenase